jgi:adenylate cyclase
MLELIAQGPTIDNRWRRTLPGATIDLGRSTEAYRVPWDSQISRRHVRVTASEHRLHVEKYPDAANPVFFNGKEVVDFHVHPGEHFVIGNTSFMLASDQAFGSMSAPDPIRQQTFSADFLEQVQYRDADRRIEILNRLPELISNANDSNELLIGMVNTLMSGIVSATSIGVVRVHSKSDEASEKTSSLEVIHWDRRGLTRGDFQPSEKLVAKATELQQSVLNVWQANSLQSNTENFTFDYENDWAFASPIETEATQGWAIYVAGSSKLQDGNQNQTVGEGDLDGDIKFCELVGATLKNLLRVQQLERQQASLRSFFSPIVVEALRGRDPDTVLQPRQCEVSVLFCDLRGFSKTSERMSDDLLELLSRVSDSLGVTTRMILETGGVIGDFHGDAVMGFWGWPLESQSTSQTAEAALQAAVRIQEEFQRLSNKSDSLKEFTMGVGIASGVAVAGKIGTKDQVKVTAFGPVVNLASRLEGLTRRFNTSILIDGKTKDRVRLESLRDSNFRRLGTFQPFGMDRTVEIHQIFCGVDRADDSTEVYSKALTAFEAGDTQQAVKLLQSANSLDKAGEFLMSYLLASAQRSEIKGVIQMDQK